MRWGLRRWSMLSRIMFCANPSLAFSATVCSLGGDGRRKNACDRGGNCAETHEGRGSSCAHVDPSARSMDVGDELSSPPCPPVSVGAIEFAEKMGRRPAEREIRWLGGGVA